MVLAGFGGHIGQMQTVGKLKRLKKKNSVFFDFGAVVGCVVTMRSQKVWHSIGIIHGVVVSSRSDGKVTQVCHECVALPTE